MQSIVDQASDAILSLILSNELRAGEPIAIIELSGRLGTSHVPVREALRRLEGQGLVEFRRGRRPRIAPIHHDEFEAVYSLRELIEGDVARRSAGKFEAAHAAQAEHLLADLERALAGGDVASIYRAHAAFHLCLLPAANAWDARLLGELWTASERYIQLYLGSRTRSVAVEEIIGLHRELLDDAAGKADISAAVVGHVRASRDYLADAVRRASGVDASGNETSTPQVG